MKKRELNNTEETFQILETRKKKNTCLSVKLIIIVITLEIGATEVKQTWEFVTQKCQYCSLFLCAACYALAYVST